MSRPSDCLRRHPRFQFCSARRLLWAVLSIAGLLTACAEQQVRRQADQQLRDAHYAEAVSVLEQGLRDHPDSVPLRKALLQARTDASTRLLTDASALLEQGKLDEAEVLLRRALSFDTGARQAEALLRAVATERRQQQAVQDAQKLIDDKQPAAAQRVIVEALKENRRYEPLLGLRRQLDQSARQAQFRAAQAGLSEQRPVSLDFRDASLRTVLDVITRNSGINFILDKDIRPDLRTTVYLRSAKVEEAIDLVLGTNGLAKKVVDGQTVLIYPNTPDKQREHQDQVVRVFYLANADAKGAAAYLRAVLKLREPFVDERTNMLTLRESPDNIELAERLIALFDASEPEVLLELEVIEVSSNRLTELGIQFPDSFSLTPLPPAGASGLTLGNLRGLNSDRIGVSVSNLLINLKRTVGDVNTLSAPRIRVKNKEKAKVLVGDKIPLITATTGTGGFVADSVSYIDVGLKLEVEPTIYTDDEVSIKIGLEVSNLGPQVKTASGTLAYQIGTRSASTLLRLRDGQTQLLAGLISRDERSNASRLPGLGDLPMVGRLFSSQLDSTQRNELMLAITPHVLRNVQQLEPSEAEMWIGSESFQRLRPPFGRVEISATPAAVGGVEPGSKPSPAAVQGTAVGGGIVPQWQGPTEARVGETFDLVLRIKSGAAVRGMPMLLGYPKDRLSLLEVSEGDYFRKNGVPTSFAKSVDSESGRVRVGLQRQQGIGASGEGEVVSFKFRALTPGAADIALLGMEPMGQDTPIERPELPLNHKVQVK